MTRPLPEHFPADDSPSDIEIPLDWSAQQALAALRWLEQLSERVWWLYGNDIQLLMRQDTSAPSLRGEDDDSSF